MIGVDPHKLSHTAVAIGGGEDELASKKVRATKNQLAQLLAWAESFPSRTWAIESATGSGSCWPSSSISPSGTAPVDDA
jgi:hypothetical protein